MVRRLIVLSLLLALTLSLCSSDSQAQSGQDLLTNSFQSCTGIPCMTVKNAAATGPWTGAKNLNDLLTYSFQSCAGIPCMTVTGISVSSSGSFGDLESGTNTTATMNVGTGSILQATGAGEIRATSMPGEGISTPIPDAFIPDLNVLSTGLTALKCVETDATGKLVSATNACNVGVGGSGTWGGITGTLSNQTDLQTALNAKVPTTRLVNGHALSSDVAVTAADVGLGNVNNTSDASKNSATAQLTNKQIVPRVQLLTVTTNQVTPNVDSTDVGYNYTFSAPLSINTPTFTLPLVDQQLLTLEFKTAAPQGITWSSGYSAECGLQLPTGTTGDGNTYNRFLLRYSITSTKWCLIANTKGDTTRLTTLATSLTYLCPADNSDTCEMSSTEATGTTAISAPSGTPANGQRLTIAIRCTNAQTLSWNAIFLDSATVTKPPSCPADTTKFVSADVRYSTVLSKWEFQRGIVVGTTLPATVVETDQGNTYTTGAQNFGSATSLILPKSAGASPTADGDVRFDTTQHLVVYGENGMLTSSPVRLLSSTEGGNSHDASGGTGDVDHTGTTVTIPANYLLQHRVLRLCVLMRFTTTASAPTYTLKVKMGTAIVFTSGNIAIASSRTNNAGVTCMTILIKDAPGGAANTYTGTTCSLGDWNSGCYNQLSQPITVPSNVAVPVVITTKWNIATAGNILTPDLLTIEALN